MITVDSKQLKSATIAIDFVQKNIPKAFGRALNRVGQGIKTEASRKVRQTYNIRDKDVKTYGNIKVKKSNVAKMQLLLTSKGRNIPLIRFRTRPSSRPIRQPKVLKAAVKKGSLKPVPGAFVASVRAGNEGVFRRVGKKRLPIQQLYGPAVPIMLGEKGVAEHLQQEAYRRLGLRLDHEVNRVLGRLKQ